MNKAAVKKGNTILRLGLILFAITFAVALLLGYVNFITKDKIAEARRLATDAAMKKIVADADSFTATDFESESDIVTGLYEAKEGGDVLAYCVTVSPSGFGGAISMIVGISRDSGEILGVEIISMSETAGLGSKAQNPAFLDQFSGGKGPFGVIKNAVPADNQVAAVTGATISSEAVTKGVNAAVGLVKSLL